MAHAQAGREQENSDLDLFHLPTTDILLGPSTGQTQPDATNPEILLTRSLCYLLQGAQPGTGDGVHLEERVATVQHIPQLQKHLNIKHTFKDAC